MASVGHRKEGINLLKTGGPFRYLKVEVWSRCLKLPMKIQGFCYLKYFDLTVNSSGKRCGGSDTGRDRRAPERHEFEPSDVSRKRGVKNRPPGAEGRPRQERRFLQAATHRPSGMGLRTMEFAVPLHRIFFCRVTDFYVKL